MKDARLELRLSVEEKQTIRQAASDMDMTISEYILYVLTLHVST